MSPSYTSAQALTLSTTLDPQAPEYSALTLVQGAFFIWGAWGQYGAQRQRIAIKGSSEEIHAQGCAPMLLLPPTAATQTLLNTLTPLGYFAPAHYVFEALLQTLCRTHHTPVHASAIVQNASTNTAFEAELLTLLATHNERASSGVLTQTLSDLLSTHHRLFKPPSTSALHTNTSFVSHTLLPTPSSARPPQAQAAPTQMMAFGALDLLRTLQYFDTHTPKAQRTSSERHTSQTLCLLHAQQSAIFHQWCSYFKPLLGEQDFTALCTHYADALPAFARTCLLEHIDKEHLRHCAQTLLDVLHTSCFTKSLGALISNEHSGGVIGQPVDKNLPISASDQILWKQFYQAHFYPSSARLNAHSIYLATQALGTYLSEHPNDPTAIDALIRRELDTLCKTPQGLTLVNLLAMYLHADHTHFNTLCTLLGFEHSDAPCSKNTFTHSVAALCAHLGANTQKALAQCLQKMDPKAALLDAQCAPLEYYISNVVLDSASSPSYSQQQKKTETVAVQPLYLSSAASAQQLQAQAQSTYNPPPGFGQLMHQEQLFALRTVVYDFIHQLQAPMVQQRSTTEHFMEDLVGSAAFFWHTPLFHRLTSLGIDTLHSVQQKHPPPIVPQSNSTTSTSTSKTDTKYPCASTQFEVLQKMPPLFGIDPISILYDEQLKKRSAYEPKLPSEPGATNMYQLRTAQQHFIHAMLNSGLASAPLSCSQRVALTVDKHSFDLHYHNLQQQVDQGLQDPITPIAYTYQSTLSAFEWLRKLDLQKFHVEPHHLTSYQGSGRIFERMQKSTRAFLEHTLSVLQPHLDTLCARDTCALIGRFLEQHDTHSALHLAQQRCFDTHPPQLLPTLLPQQAGAHTDALLHRLWKPKMTLAQGVHVKALLDTHPALVLSTAYEPHSVAFFNTTEARVQCYQAAVALDAHFRDHLPASEQPPKVTLLDLLTDHPGMKSDNPDKQRYLERICSHAHSAHKNNTPINIPDSTDSMSYTHTVLHFLDTLRTLNAQHQERTNPLLPAARKNMLNSNNVQTFKHQQFCALTQTPLWSGALTCGAFSDKKRFGSAMHLISSLMRHQIANSPTDKPFYQSQLQQLALAQVLPGTQNTAVRPSKSMRL